MKSLKSFIAFAALCVVVVSCGPSIVLNTETQGERRVLTSEIKLASNDYGNFYTSLGAIVTEKDTVLAILVSCDADATRSVFTKGSKFRIKFTDNTEVALENIFENEFQTEDKTRVIDNYRTDYGYLYSYGPLYGDIYVEPYAISRIVPQVTHYKQTNSYALFLISKHQAYTIGNKQAAKIRIESQSGDVDITDQAKINSVFSSLYECLVPAVQKPNNTNF